MRALVVRGTSEREVLRALDEDTKEGSLPAELVAVMETDTFGGDSVERTDDRGYYLVGMAEEEGWESPTWLLVYGDPVPYDTLDEAIGAAEENRISDIEVYRLDARGGLQPITRGSKKRNPKGKAKKKSTKTTARRGVAGRDWQLTVYNEDRELLTTTVWPSKKEAMAEGDEATERDGFYEVTFIGSKKNPKGKSAKRKDKFTVGERVVITVDDEDESAEIVDVSGGDMTARVIGPGARPYEMELEGTPRGWEDARGRSVGVRRDNPRKGQRGDHIACGTEISNKDCRQLQHVYKSARKRKASKTSAAQQAWGSLQENPQQLARRLARGG